MMWFSSTNCQTDHIGGLQWLKTYNTFSVFTFYSYIWLLLPPDNFLSRLSAGARVGEMHGCWSGSAGPHTHLCSTLSKQGTCYCMCETRGTFVLSLHVCMHAWCTIHMHCIHTCSFWYPPESFLVVTCYIFVSCP